MKKERIGNNESKSIELQVVRYSNEKKQERQHFKPLENVVDFLIKNIKNNNEARIIKQYNKIALPPCRNPALRNALRDDIERQSPGITRGLIESISNACDSSAKRVNVTIRDGEYVVTDEGTGIISIYHLLIPKMSTKEKKEAGIGTFGLGFWTNAKLLRTPSDLLILETKNQHNIAYRITIKKESTGYKIAIEDRTAVHTQIPQGTRISVRSSLIKESRYRRVPKEYFRYFFDSEIWVNNTHINRKQGIKQFQPENKPCSFIVDTESKEKKIQLSVNGVKIRSFAIKASTHKASLVLDFSKNGIYEDRNEITVNQTLRKEAKSIISLLNTLKLDLNLGVYYFNAISQAIAYLERSNPSNRKEDDLIAYLNEQLQRYKRQFQNIYEVPMEPCYKQMITHNQIAVTDALLPYHWETQIGQMIAEWPQSYKSQMYSVTMQQSNKVGFVYDLKRNYIFIDSIMYSKWKSDNEDWIKLESMLSDISEDMNDPVGFKLETKSKPSATSEKKEIKKLAKGELISKHPPEGKLSFCGHALLKEHDLKEEKLSEREKSILTKAKTLWVKKTLLINARTRYCLHAYSIRKGPLAGEITLRMQYRSSGDTGQFVLNNRFQIIEKEIEKYSREKDKKPKLPSPLEVELIDKKYMEESNREIDPWALEHDWMFSRMEYTSRKQKKYSLYRGFEIASFEGDSEAKLILRKGSQSQNITTSCLMYREPYFLFLNSRNQWTLSNWASNPLFVFEKLAGISLSSTYKLFRVLKCDNNYIDIYLQDYIYRADKKKNITEQYHTFLVNDEILYLKENGSGRAIFLYKNDSLVFNLPSALDPSKTIKDIDKVGSIYCLAIDKQKLLIVDRQGRLISNVNSESACTRQLKDYPILIADHHIFSGDGRLIYQSEKRHFDPLVTVFIYPNSNRFYVLGDEASQVCIVDVSPTKIDKQTVERVLFQHKSLFTTLFDFYVFKAKNGQVHTLTQSRVLPFPALGRSSSEKHSEKHIETLYYMPYKNEYFQLSNSNGSLLIHTPINQHNRIELLDKATFVVTENKDTLLHKFNMLTKALLQSPHVIENIDFLNRKNGLTEFDFSNCLQFVDLKPAIFKALFPYMKKLKFSINDKKARALLSLLTPYTEKQKLFIVDLYNLIDSTSGDHVKDNLAKKLKTLLNRFGISYLEKYYIIIHKKLSQFFIYTNDKEDLKFLLTGLSDYYKQITLFLLTPSEKLFMKNFDDFSPEINWFFSKFSLNQFLSAVYSGLNVDEALKRSHDFKKSEAASRALNHAVSHQSSSAHCLYIREFLQNAIDASNTHEQKPPTIPITLYRNKENQCVLRIRDAGAGMSKKDILTYALQPGSTTKQNGKESKSKWLNSGNHYGGRGVGLFSTLAGAAEVRIVSSDSTLYHYDFRLVPQYNNKGNIEDVAVFFKRGIGGFKGTMIERTSRELIPELEAALLEQGVMRHASYINPELVLVTLNKNSINKQIEALARLNSKNMGLFQLFMATDNVITAGGLYVKRLIKDDPILAKIPNTIKSLLIKSKVALDFPKRTALTRARNEFQNPTEQFYALLQPIIANIAITAYLQLFYKNKVTLDELPNDFFRLNSARLFKIKGREFLYKINLSQEADHFHKNQSLEHQDKFLENKQLLTDLLCYIKFIPVHFKDKKPVTYKSLIEIYKMYHNNELNPNVLLPDQLQRAMSRAQSSSAVVSLNEKRLSEIKNKLHKKFSIQKEWIINHENLSKLNSWGLYLYFCQQLLIQLAPNKKNVSIHSSTKELDAIAYTRPNSNWIFFNPLLLTSCNMLRQAMQKKSYDGFIKHFRAEFISTINTIVHELTHIDEKSCSGTHNRDFRMRMLSRKCTFFKDLDLKEVYQNTKAKYKKWGLDKQAEAKLTQIDCIRSLTEATSFRSLLGL